MKNAAKFSLMPATVCVMKKSKIFYALLYFFLSTVSLSFFRCLSAVYCLPVCLSVCLSMQGQLLQTFDIRYSEWSFVQVFQKVFNIFNNLDPLYAFYFSQWFILFTFFWRYINFLFQGKSSTHKKESCYSGT